MKQEQCPNCNGILAVPDKLRGKRVECPVCKLIFVPEKSAPTAKMSTTEQKAAIASLSDKQTLRSVPLPLGLPTSASSSAKSKLEGVKPAIDLNPTPTLIATKKPRLSTIAPPSSPKPSPAKTKTTSADDTDDFDLDNSLAATVIDSSDDSKALATVKTSRKSAQKIQAVAKIIKTEQVQPTLTKDGKLPTLKLIDLTKSKETDTELKNNPVLIGLLICFSLLSSGLMLFLVGMQPSIAEQKVKEARERIQEFYEVRLDGELAPYQRELREAQLAHSSGDRPTEIKRYQQVMSRFHTENIDKFKGLTGSPTKDIELENYVSTLLTEARKKLKKF